MWRASMALLALPLWAAPQLPDGEALTRQSQEAFQKLHSLQMVTQSTTEMTVSDSPVKTTTTITQAFLNPGKSRTEVQTPTGVVLVVSDGETYWVYSGITHEYTKRSAALGVNGVMSTVGIKLPDLSTVKMKSRTLREETVEIEGKKHDCWVVQHQMELPPMGGPDGPKTSPVDSEEWIDKKLGIGLRREFSFAMQIPGASAPMVVRQAMITTSLKVNQTVADSVFTFGAPFDAHEVAEILNAPNAPKTDLQGAEAPGFSVKSLDAASFSKSSLAGKAVLLDFWATWCGPCRKSLPVVDKLSREFRSQGLEVLGVNAGEDRDTVQEFLKATPMPYPVVLGVESDILAVFHVTAYPTFVLIGRDGRIVEHVIGFGGESALRAMLEKAGITTTPKPQ